MNTTSSTTIRSDDRRACPRVAVQRPCKIKVASTGKYLAAATIDLSQHGILVRLLKPSNLKPGDEVFIGVAMHERQGLLQEKEMIDSRVVRRLEAEDGTTTLAVQFHAAMLSQHSDQSQRRAA